MKAQKATINYNGIELEVYQLPNGEYHLSKTQVGSAIEKHDKSLREWIEGKSPEALPYKDFTFREVELETSPATFHSVPLNIAAAYWTYWASKGNTIAMALVSTSVVESLTRLCDTAFGIKTDEIQMQKQNIETKQINEMFFKMMNMMEENSRQLKETKSALENANNKITEAKLEIQKTNRDMAEIKNNNKETLAMYLEAHIEKQNLESEVEELTEFKEDVELYSEFMYLLDVAKNEICETSYLEGISCKDYLTSNKIPLDENSWCTLSRRTASFYRSTKGRNPEKSNGKFIYRCKDVAYIVATIRLIMKGL